jgi:rRNA-processing protein FCF1
VRKFYLLDTSAAKFFYLPNAPGNTEANLAFLAAKKLGNECVLFIPSFCIAELFNVLACYHYRDKSISKPDYERYIGKAKDHVRNHQRFLRPLELTRYHNYRLDSIFPIEHGTATEYDAAGIKAPADPGVINEALRVKIAGDHAGKYHLSAFDLLILAMGIELGDVHGPENVAIITNDKRLAKVALAANGIGSPIGYYAIGTKTADLTRFHNG